jgi:hypothetical protein
VCDCVCERERESVCVCAGVRVCVCVGAHACVRMLVGIRCIISFHTRQHGQTHLVHNVLL